MTDSMAADTESPTRDSILTLLDHEIAHAQSDEQRSGWTLWGLGGALAGIAVAATGLWTEGGFSVAAVVQWFVVFALFFDPIINWVIRPLDIATEPQPGRYQTLEQFEHQRWGFLWRVIHASSVSFGAWRLFDGVAPLARYYATGVYALSAVMFAVTLGMSMLEWPSRKATARPWVMMITGAVFVIPSLLCAAAYMGELSIPQPGTSSASLQLGALLYLTSVIIFRLLLGLRRPWVVRNLVNIRRNLALGNIGVSTARRDVEIALLGTEGHRTVESYMLRVLAFHEEYSDAEVRLSQHLQAVAETMQRLRSANAGSPTDKLRSSVQESLDAAKKELARAQKVATKIKSRMGRADVLANQVQEEAPATFWRGHHLLRQTQESVNHQNQKLFERLAEHERIVSDLAARFTDPSRS